MRMMGGFDDITIGRSAVGVEAVRQRAYRILDTPPGALPQDPEWGWGIRDLIGVGLEPGDLRTQEAIGRAAFRRDPEVVDASVAITPVDVGRYRIDVTLSTAAGATTVSSEVP
jgi:phage baseplate assembly protein W